MWSTDDGAALWIHRAGYRHQSSADRANVLSSYPRSNSSLKSRRGPQQLNPYFLPHGSFFGAAFCVVGHLDQDVSLHFRAMHQGSAADVHGLQFFHAQHLARIATHCIAGRFDSHERRLCRSHLHHHHREIDQVTDFSLDTSISR